MSNRKTILSALLVMLLWGTLFPMVKLGYSAYNIVTAGDILYFAGVRFTVCGAVICIYTLITDKASYKAVKSAVVPVLLSGVFAVILHYGFTYTGLMLTESSKTAILKQIGVLIYVCFSSLFFRDDKLTAGKLAGVIMGFAGVVAINAGMDGISFNIGDVLIIAASLCTVISNIISKKVFAVVKPVTSTGVSQLFGGVILLTVGRFAGGSMSIASDSSACVIIYICAASIISYCLWYTTVKNGHLSKLFIIKFAESMFACIFGALLLNENIFRTNYLAALVLIVCGIYVSSKS